MPSPFVHQPNPVNNGGGREGEEVGARVGPRVPPSAAAAEERGVVEDGREGGDRVATPEKRVHAGEGGGEEGQKGGRGRLLRGGKGV